MQQMLTDRTKKAEQNVKNLAFTSKHQYTNHQQGHFGLDAQFQVEFITLKFLYDCLGANLSFNSVKGEVVKLQEPCTSTVIFYCESSSSTIY